MYISIFNYFYSIQNPRNLEMAIPKLVSTGRLNLLLPRQGAGAHAEPGTSWASPAPTPALGSL